MCALVRNDRLDTADDRPINIYLKVVPTATPCVPLERGKSLIDGAGKQTDKQKFPDLLEVA